MQEKKSARGMNFPKARVKSLVAKMVKQHCAYSNEPAYRISDSAIDIVDDALKVYLEGLVRDALAVAKVAKRVTLYEQDFKICLKFHKEESKF